MSTRSLGSSASTTGSGAPDVNEIEVYAGPESDRFGESRFGMARSAPRIWSGEMVDVPPPPVTFAAVQDVVECLCPGGAWWNGARHVVTPHGFLRVDCLNGFWIYELFPARWSDGHGGPFYLCVWRD